MKKWNAIKLAVNYSGCAVEPGIIKVKTVSESRTVEIDNFMESTLVSTSPRPTPSPPPTTPGRTRPRGTTGPGGNA